MFSVVLLEECKLTKEGCRRGDTERELSRYLKYVTLTVSFTQMQFGFDRDTLFGLCIYLHYLFGLSWSILIS